VSLVGQQRVESVDAMEDTAEIARDYAEENEKGERKAKQTQGLGCTLDMYGVQPLSETKLSDAPLLETKSVG